MKLSLVFQAPETLTRSPISLLSGFLDETLAKAVRWAVDGLELMLVDPLGLDAAALSSKFEEYRLEVVAVGIALLSLVASRTLLTPEGEKAVQAREQLYQTIDFTAHQTMDAGRLRYVHLAEDNRHPMGLGLVNFRSILAVISEFGNDCYLTLEILAKPDPDSTTRQGLACTYSLL